MHSDANSRSLDDLRRLAAHISEIELAPRAAEIDAKGAWPEAQLQSLAAAGLMGLHIPERLGGMELGLEALIVISEELGRGCSSTAMCFSMHSVAAKVLVAKATPDHEDRFLRPMAEGRHITSLALSEPQTGAHFFLPRARFVTEGEAYRIDGEKSFVTSGGHADSFVVSAVSPDSDLDPGTFTCLVVEAGSSGLDWGRGWQGFGMRGNSSRPVSLNGVKVPKANLLGAEGDQIWYMFEIIAPYFLMAMTGTYLGIARAALDEVVAHMKSREHSHTGETLSDIPVLWHEVAQAWTDVEATRQLALHAARQGDADHPEAALAIFAAKAKVAQTVTAVTETAMRLMGGRAYADNSRIARLHRDARAAHVMAPTTHMLQGWLGRSLLGMPIL